MSKVTLQQARKLLPEFSCGLGMYAKTVIALRDMVAMELQDYKDGANPLTPKQVRALQNFLAKTESE